MEVVVVRESSAAPLILKVFVDETSPDKLNRYYFVCICIMS